MKYNYFLIQTTTIGPLLFVDIMPIILWSASLLTEHIRPNGILNYVNITKPHGLAVSYQHNGIVRMYFKLNIGNTSLILVVFITNSSIVLLKRSESLNSN